MSLFKGISNAAGNGPRSEFYAGGELYVVRMGGHEQFKSKNPKNIGITFVNARGNVLETSCRQHPPGTSVVEMFKFKPAMTPEDNVTANGPALARLRTHGAVVYRAMLEQKRDAGEEGFADLTEDQIEAAIGEIVNDDDQFDAFFKSLVEANAAEGIVLGVSTAAIKTKDGGDFTQITYTTDVASIRDLIAQRKSQAA